LFFSWFSWFLLAPASRELDGTNPPPLACNRGYVLLLLLLLLLLLFLFLFPYPRLIYGGLMPECVFPFVVNPKLRCVLSTRRIYREKKCCSFA
jgi:hypothetical protein